MVNLNFIHRLFLIVAFAGISNFVSAQSPEFTSTPVEEGRLGEYYQYNITTSGWWFFEREIILTGGELPDGIELTDHGNGTAVMEGIPEDAGAYPIELTVRRVSNHNQFSTQSFTLTIRKYAATVTLHELNAVYNGSPYAPEVTTSPPGLDVDLTYNGSSNPPTNAGSYTVEALIDEDTYEGSTTGTLVIEKASATVQIANNTKVYNGSQQSPTAITSPQGLSVAFTFNGNATAPVNAGTYQVKASISDPNYTGSATGTFIIEKREAAVNLSNLAAIYDGSAKPVTVSTSPEGLNVDVTYNGVASPPVDRGSYTVEAVVNEQNYFGAASGTLVISDDGNGGGGGGNADGRPFISNFETETMLYRQGDPGMSITESLIINDFDDTEMEEASVSIDLNYIEGEDMLIYENEENENIVAEFDEQQGILTLSGTDTRSNYEIALSKVLYRNNLLGETFNTEKRVKITVNDGVYDSKPVSRDITIVVLPELDIVNAFTPNGDNVNDHWNFVNLELYSVISISIFDKNGTEVFNCFEPDCAWDGSYNGKMLPTGIYFYTIDLDNGKRKYRGTVALLK